MTSVYFKTFFDILIFSLILLLVSVMGGIGFEFAIGKTVISLHSFKNVLIFTLFIWIIKKIVGKGKIWHKTDLDFPVLIYLGTFIVAVLFSSQLKVSFLFFCYAFNCIALTYLLINNIDDKKKLEAVLFIIMISIVYVAARGTIQHINTRLGYEDGNYYGFGGRAEFGAAIVLAIPILISFLINYRKNSAAAIFFISGLIILITGLIASYSRGSWLAFIIVLLFLNFLYNNLLKKWRSFVLIILVFILLFLVMPPGIKERIVSITDFTHESNGDRISIWKSSAKMIKDFPFFGTGPGTYDVYYPKYMQTELVGITYEVRKGIGWHAHNIFLHIASENGIIGLTGYLLVIFVSYKKFFEIKALVKDTHLKNLLYGAMASLTGYLACSQSTIFFANHNKNEKIAMFFWFDIALIFIVENIIRKENNEKMI